MSRQPLPVESSRKNSLRSADKPHIHRLPRLVLVAAYTEGLTKQKEGSVSQLLSRP